MSVLSSSCDEFYGSESDMGLSLRLWGLLQVRLLICIGSEDWPTWDTSVCALSRLRAVKF